METLNNEVAYPYLTGITGYWTGISGNILVLWKNIGAYGYYEFHIKDGTKKPIAVYNGCGHKRIGLDYLSVLPINTFIERGTLTSYRCKRSKDQDCYKLKCDKTVYTDELPFELKSYDPIIPDAPYNLTTILRDRSITVIWDAVTNTDIFAYQLTIIEKITGTIIDTGYLPGNKRQYEFTDLQNGTEYIITIGAINHSNIKGNDSSIEAIPEIPTTGDLVIISTPSEANISIDDIDQEPVTPTTITGLSPGPHYVKLTLPGYEDWTETVNVVSGTTTIMDVTLIPIYPGTGSLNIISTPYGANISIDGIDREPVTPTTITGLSPGPHYVKLTLSGYEEWEDTVDVVADTTTVIDIDLIPIYPGTGSLNIISTPPGANISIDDIDQEPVTPTTITGLSPGPHYVKLTLSGYEEWEDTVDVVADTTTVIDIDLIPISPDTGSLNIISTPPGANISIDDIDQEPVTPTTITGLSPGPHYVKLTLLGYEDWEDTVNVIANTTTVIDITLQETVSPTPEGGAGVVITMLLGLASAVSLLER